MLDQFKMGLELLVTADFANLFTWKGGGGLTILFEVDPQSTKGVGSRHQVGWVPGMQGDNFATELSGICAPLLVGLSSSLGLVPKYVVLV